MGKIGLYCGAFFNALTVEVGVHGVLEQCARAEVDELELAGAQVDQDVLVLDVAVHDAARVAVTHRLEHLAKEAARELFRERAFLRDEVEQVFHGLWSLHDDDEGVRALVPVQHLDYTAESGADFLQQDNLHGHARSVRLEREGKKRHTRVQDYNRVFF